MYRYFPCLDKAIKFFLSCAVQGIFQSPEVQYDGYISRIILMEELFIQIIYY